MSASSCTVQCPSVRDNNLEFWNNWCDQWVSGEERSGNLSAYIMNTIILVTLLLVILASLITAIEVEDVTSSTEKSPVKRLCTYCRGKPKKCSCYLWKKYTLSISILQLKYWNILQGQRKISLFLWSQSSLWRRKWERTRKGEDEQWQSWKAF